MRPCSVIGSRVCINYIQYALSLPVHAFEQALVLLLVWTILSFANTRASADGQNGE